MVTRKAPKEEFVMDVTDITYMTGRGIVLVGKATQGWPTVGEDVEFGPFTATVTGIESTRKMLDGQPFKDGHLALVVRFGHVQPGTVLKSRQ